MEPPTLCPWMSGPVTVRESVPLPMGLFTTSLTQSLLPHYAVMNQSVIVETCGWKHCGWQMGICRDRTPRFLVLGSHVTWSHIPRRAIIQPVWPPGTMRHPECYNPELFLGPFLPKSYNKKRVQKCTRTHTHSPSLLSNVEFHVEKVSRILTVLMVGFGS
jgi:hypothetical protein